MPTADQLGRSKALCRLLEGDDEDEQEEDLIPTGVPVMVLLDEAGSYHVFVAGNLWATLQLPALELLGFVVSEVLEIHRFRVLSCANGIVPFSSGAGFPKEVSWPRAFVTLIALALGEIKDVDPPRATLTQKFLNKYDGPLVDSKCSTVQPEKLGERIFDCRPSLQHQKTRALVSLF